MSTRHNIIPIAPKIVSDLKVSTINSQNIYNNSTKTIDAPVDDNDVTNKLYVDSSIVGLTWQCPCQLATTGVITLSGLQLIDGFTTVSGDRVLVKDQGTIENGYYSASSGSWTRTTDMPIGASVSSYTCVVQQGTANGDNLFICVNDPNDDIVGTDILLFEETSGAGVLSINTLTNPIQLLTTGTTGSDFNISSVTDTHTFNIPDASGSERGALISADWTTFNNKQDTISLSSYTTGPASSTANGISRYNGTTGKIIQDSTVTIDDSGSVNNALFTIDAGTVSLPNITFTGTSSTGIYSTSTGTVENMNFALNGTEALRFEYDSSLAVSLQNGILPISQLRHTLVGSPSPLYAFTSVAYKGLGIDTVNGIKLHGDTIFRDIPTNKYAQLGFSLSEIFSTVIDLGPSTTTTINIGRTGQSIGFFGKTAAVQPTSGVIVAATFVANTSGISDDTATFDGYTIGQIAAAMIQGLIT